MQTAVFEQSANIGDLAAALAAAQAEFPVLDKDKEVEVETRNGGKYTFMYADLVSINKDITPILAAHGLSIVQPPGWDDINDNHVLTTQLNHSSGQWMRSTAKLTIAQESPQVYGSAVTYFRRYCKCAMLDLVADTDDDGKAAQDAAEASGSTRRRSPASSRSTGGKRTGGRGKQQGTEWDSRQRNKVIRALGQAGIRTDDEIKEWIQNELGLPEKLAPAQLTAAQGLTLEEKLGVPPVDAAPAEGEQGGDAE